MINFGWNCPFELIRFGVKQYINFIVLSAHHIPGILWKDERKTTKKNCFCLCCGQKRARERKKTEKKKCWKANLKCIKPVHQTKFNNIVATWREISQGYSQTCNIYAYKTKEKKKVELNESDELKNAIETKLKRWKPREREREKERERGKRKLRIFTQIEWHKREMETIDVMKAKCMFKRSKAIFTKWRGKKKEERKKL